jgi:hypothetical protein
VKRGLLRLQLGDQFSGPVNRDLIANSSLYSAIPFDVFLYLYALFTHGQFRIRAWGGEQPPHL